VYKQSVRILIADDDALSRRVLELTLRRLGHEPVIVTNGTDAQEALLCPDGPRLAILDWMMPGADGLSVCRAVRRRVGPYVYVVLLTARDRQEDMVVALEADVDDFLTKPLDAGELQARLRSGERLLTLQENLLQAQEALRHQAEALRHQATHDDLTGLWNRAMVRDNLMTELSRGKRAGKPVAVVLADLDHFKNVNDTHGHAAGDAILREAAARMRLALRTYDSIGRYGGEEFLIVLPSCDTDAAVDVAERARVCVAAPMRIGDVDMPLSVSLGVASTRTAPEDPDGLIQAADDALYRAKAGGRNRVSA
jgi:two-component system cell cycle response regulator